MHTALAVLGLADDAASSAGSEHESTGEISSSSSDGIATALEVIGGPVPGAIDSAMAVLGGAKLRRYSKERGLTLTMIILASSEVHRARCSTAT